MPIKSIHSGSMCLFQYINYVIQLLDMGIEVKYVHHILPINVYIYYKIWTK